MLALALRYWRVIAIALGTIVLLVSLYFWKQSYDSGLRAEGYAKAQAEYAAAQASAAKTANKRIAEKTRNFEKVKGDIENAPDDLACGALTDPVIDGMRGPTPDSGE